jgi:hypothetical protein
LSSSGAETSIRAFIEASFVALREEFPEAYFLMCRRLAGMTATLLVDDERIGLVFDRRAVRVRGMHPRADVRVRTSRRAILDILHARLTLQAAVDDGSLQLWGSIANLEAFHEALLVYVRGAVRSPSFGPLWARFRDGYFMATLSPIPGSNSSQQ